MSIKEIKQKLRFIGYKLRMLLPKKIAHAMIYNKSHNKKISFSNPITYDEKIHWLSANVYDKGYSMYVDKYAVREYVKKCGLEDMLIPLLGVYKTADEINYSALPKSFIIKATHASGPKFYELCLNKDSLDIDRVTKKMNIALNTNFGYRFCEYQYSGIKPLLICEALLTNDGTERLDDYKVVCANGEPKCILVCSDRDEGRDYYSTDWEYLDFTTEQSRSNTKKEKPRVLNEMLDAARVLSKPFPFARIDFYIVNDKIFFGEITLTPSSGNHAYLKECAQVTLGSYIQL